MAASSTRQFTSGLTAEVRWRVEPADSVSFPLRAAPVGRYLVDADQRPFRIQGDAAWSLIANLTPSEIDLYLADRKSRGFNALVVNLLEHAHALRAPANRAGDAPFAAHADGVLDFARPDEAYFSFADEVLAKAQARGFGVFLSVMYLGVEGSSEGFWAELNDPRNSPAVCRDYGRFLGRRYKARSNLIWVIGGDRTPPAGSNAEQRLLQILAGIRDVGAEQLATTHCSPERNGDDWLAFRPSLQLVGAYGYGERTWSRAAAAFAYTPATPAFLLEAGYEAEAHAPGDPASVRANAWWGQLETVAGQFYGHRDVWPFQTDTWNNNYPYGRGHWRDALAAPGARAMSRMAALLQMLAWYELRPSGQDGVKPLVVAGAGDGMARASAAADPQGSLLVAYLPQAHPGSVTLDLSALNGPARARFWDPTSGQFVPLGRFANKGPIEFERPGPNASGDSDWLLVLETGEGPSCGAITDTGLYTAPPIAPNPPSCAVVATNIRDPRATERTLVEITP